MTQLTTALADVCREHVLDEKWLIAPSRRVGYQWLDAVTRGGQPVVNARVKTLASMAIELAGPEMATKNVTRVPAAAGPLVVDSIWSQRAEGGGGNGGGAGGYLRSLEHRFELSRTLHASLAALRLAGLNSESVDPRRFEVPAKGSELVEVLRDYESALRSRNWVDMADVLRMGIERLRREPGVLGREVRVLIPEDLDREGLVQELLDAIPPAQRVTLAVDQPIRVSAAAASEGAAATPESDAGLLRWLFAATDAPSPRGDGTARVFRAVGEVNEVRAVLRECIARGTRLDEIELLHTDAGTYVPLVFETARRLEQDEGPLSGGLPVTFAEGIPASYSRPGRSLAAWLAWIADGFPQAALARMIQDALLEVPGLQLEQVSFTRLAGWFRTIGIGWDRVRYLPKLDAEINGLRDRVAAGAFVDEDGESDSERTESAARRLDSLGRLRELVATLLELSGDEGRSQADQLRDAARFLESVVRSTSELDNLARQRLLQSVTEMAHLVELAEAPRGLNVRQWLASLPAEIRVGGSGPRPGHLHVAHVMSGGHSGRPHTFIVGLDDSRFAGAGLQDPLLLDIERRNLSPHLKTAADGLRHKLESFGRLLARLRGTVTLSYSCRNLIDDREVFPSPWLLTAWRIVSGERSDDLAAMQDALDEAASFAPPDAAHCLTDADWWLLRLCGPGGVREPREIVGRMLPHLGRGQLAERQRGSAAFTVFDGWVESPGPELNPVDPHGPRLSSRSLETLGRCPLAYYFLYVLGIAPPDELELDPTRWLDPLQSGLLLHEVFERFMRELVERGQTPQFDRDVGRLRQILSDRIAFYRDICPPPSDGVYRRELKQLTRTANTFLREEEQFCRSSRPQFLEAQVGTLRGEPLTPLDSREPVPLRLPDGRVVRVRGKIDRVDQIGDDPPLFSVWDYKTGSPWKYSGKDPFQQGRLVQHVLYIEMVKARLRERVARQASVDHFGYFFPSARGRGARRRFKPAEVVERGLNVISQLVEIAARGAFLATNDKSDCEYCDYRPICRDIAAVTRASQEKLNNDGNELLQSMRELRPNAKAK